MTEEKSVIEDYIDECDGSETDKVRVMQLEVDISSGICKVVYQDTVRMPSCDPDRPFELPKERIWTTDLISEMVGFVELGLLRYQKESYTNPLKYIIYRVNSRR